jgi:hypothetical protein
MGKTKFPVSERALIQRINRKLAADDEKLKKLRSKRWRSAMGTYFIINVRGNFVNTKHVEIEAYGRELGVLTDWEELVLDE